MLFTPAGEERWVPGWEPVYLHPEGKATQPGMIFTTGAGEGQAIWYLADFDTTRHYSRYVRTTPGLRTGTVEILCTPDGDEATLVQVTYELVALSLAGADELRDFEGPAFVAMIEGWRTVIEERIIAPALAAQARPG